MALEQVAEAVELLFVVVMLRQENSQVLGALDLICLDLGLMHLG